MKYKFRIKDEDVGEWTSPILEFPDSVSYNEYVGVGSFCFLCREKEPQNAGESYRLVNAAPVRMAPGFKLRAIPTPDDLSNLGWECAPRPVWS